MERRCRPTAVVHIGVLAVMFLAVLLVPARALPKYLAVFARTYSPKAGSPLARAKCVTCHAAAGPPQRNSYGSMVEQAMRTANSRDLTSTMLHSIDGADADKDGATNGDEIAAGTLPGDANSHPAASGTPAARMSVGANSSTAPGSATDGPGTPAVSPMMKMLMPKHTFHPIIVHFAEALFVVGGLMELYGLRKRRQMLREAGFLNMWIGTLAAFVAVATGLIAAYRNGFSFRGFLLYHLIAGIAALIGMAATSYVGYRAARSGGERASRLYVGLVALSILLVSTAGFFGGEFVYTELMGM